MPTLTRRLVLTSSLAVLACVWGPPASAQWNPQQGQWGEQPSGDLRVMTWNVEDGLCSTNAKVEGLNNWCALARIVAALRPDVLILQETGDNSGNGTGGGVDSVADLATTLDLFLHGGSDPFTPGTPAVTAWVGKYAPNYDLPHVFVSAASDGFNRNVILSRYPFADLNGDTQSTRSDMPFLFGSAYALGPNGGIRGFQHAEIDLPDADYASDLVIGNSHLKSGSGSSQTERVIAAQNIAYYIDFLYNGAGTGVPDPQGVINDQPPATHVLDALTLVVSGGDWNEDEAKNGAFRGPAAWISEAEFPDGPMVSDGTDRDRTDMVYDDARDLFNGVGSTQGSSKLDYLAWQDSIASLRRAFLFNTLTMPSAALPSEVQGFPNPLLASTQASDHRPVIVDLVLPEPLPVPTGLGGILAPPGSRTIVLP
jgi:endonuclease/exonuclease/phosphatase family metal-dependent hydrolase